MIIIFYLNRAQTRLKDADTAKHGDVPLGDNEH